MKEAEHVRFAAGAAVRRWLVLAAVGALSLSVGAQPLTTQQIPNTTSGFGAWYYAGGARVGAQGVNLAPMPTTAANPLNLSGWTQAGNYGLAPGATGITVNAESDFATPGNPKGVKVGVATKLTPLGVAKAVGNLATKIATPLVIGSAVYDLARELGFDLLRDGAGQLVVKQADPEVCTVAPCYGYRISSGLYTPSFYSSSLTAAAGVWAAGASAASASFDWSVISCNLGALTCQFQRTGQSSGVETLGASTTPASPQPESWLPSDRQAFEDAVAAKSGWPTSSNAARAAKQALEQNIPVAVDPPVVSGPASNPGPTTTTQNPDGTTTTKTTTNNYNYAGDTITYNTTFITTVMNGTTTISTTTETTEGDGPTEDLCKVNPDTVGCTKLGDPPTEDIPKSTKEVAYTEDNVGIGGGSCPAPVQLGTGRTLYFDPVCDKLVLARPIVLAMASFTALLIVLGIRSEST